MPAPTITPLPTPPSRSTDPTNFAIEADAFVAALPDFATEANAQASYLDGLATAVDADATAAAADADTASAAADAALAAADAGLWVSGTTYAIGDNVISPINFQTYRRITNGAGTTDPSADATNYVLITFYPSTPFAVIGNASGGAELRLPEDTDNGSNYVALKAPSTLASNLSLTLPSADGTNGQALVTNGSGGLSFAAVGGSSIQATASGSITAGKPVVMNSAGTVSEVSASAIAITSQTDNSVLYSGPDLPTLWNNGSEHWPMTFDTKRNTYWKIQHITNTTQPSGGFVLIGYDASNPDRLVGRHHVPLNGGSAADNTSTLYYGRLTYHPILDCLIFVYNNETDTTTYYRFFYLTDNGIANGPRRQLTTNLKTIWDAAVDPVTNNLVLFARIGTTNAYASIWSVAKNSLTSVNNSILFATAGSFGAAAFQNGTSNFIFISSNNKIVAGSWNSGASFYDIGTQTTFNANVYDDRIDIQWCPSQSCYVGFAWNTSGYPFLQAFTVSSNTITAGTAVVTTAMGSNFGYGSFAVNRKTNVIYVSNTSYYKEATISGTTITFNATTVDFSNVFGNNAYSNPRSFHNEHSGIFVVHRTISSASSQYGIGYMMVESSNLNDSNFVGIAQSSVSNGQTATVQVVGAVNTGQSGLTAGKKYFANIRGELTTANTASYAGLATSATNLLIKG